MKVKCSTKGLSILISILVLWLPLLGGSKSIDDLLLQHDLQSKPNWQQNDESGRQWQDQKESIISEEIISQLWRSYVQRTLIMQEKKPKFISSCESLSDYIFFYGVGQDDSYWDTVYSIIGYNGRIYKHGHNVSMTLKTRTRIKIPDTNDP